MAENTTTTIRPALRPQAAPSVTTTRLHWVVRVQHRMRTASFAAAFVGMSVQFWDKGYPGWTWLLLALQFLVYPQLVFWRAKRAATPLQAELNNLLIDSMLFGLWVGALGFPVWIGFTLFVATTLNNTISRGWTGAMRSIALFALGALLAGAVTGFKLSFTTEPATAVMCVIGLSLYLLTLGQLGFSRNRRLREAGLKLKQGEVALLAANLALRERLDEIDQLQEKLGELVNLDPLTGLYNRRYLNSTLERELARCARDGQPLSLMMIDIDHFKRINDMHGHQAGDEVLARIGELLVENARTEDVACRYGGEEFLLLLPTMPIEVARQRAERLRQAFSDMQIMAAGVRIQATLSVGIASYPEHALSPDLLIRSADIALYSAKASGRDRVVVFEHQQVGAPS